MPLSEHEERILAEIERQLEAEDPRFAARSRRPSTSSLSWSPTLRLRLAAALGFFGVVGVLLLIVSVAFAAVGLVMIFSAILLAATTVRQQGTQPPTRTPSPDDAL